MRKRKKAGNGCIDELVFLWAFGGGGVPSY
jgi:hypothetical protein